MIRTLTAVLIRVKARCVITSHFDTARRCKLYDFKRLCWTDFRGCPTNRPLPLPDMNGAPKNAENATALS